jgi:hypothetical protein
MRTEAFATIDVPLYSHPKIKTRTRPHQTTGLEPIGHGMMEGALRRIFFFARRRHPDELCRRKRYV